MLTRRAHHNRRKIFTLSDLTGDAAIMLLLSLLPLTAPGATAEVLRADLPQLAEGDTLQALVQRCRKHGARICVHRCGACRPVSYYWHPTPEQVQLLESFIAVQ